MFELLGAVGGIVLVDLALSGDNALVIGAAAAALPARQRRLAIMLGGGAAIALRVICAVLATLLLQLPLLQAVGGLLLLVIAVRLLMGRDEGPHGHSAESGASPAKSLRGALVTILVADVTMSLDNVLAIGALAHGNLPLLVVGLLLSVGLLLVGSSVMATLIGRLPWLLDVAAVVLGWTAGNMLLHDARLGLLLSEAPLGVIWVHALPIAFVLAADFMLRLRSKRRAVRVVAAGEASEASEAGDAEAASERARAAPEGVLR